MSRVLTIGRLRAIRHQLDKWQRELVAQPTSRAGVTNMTACAWHCDY